MRIEIINTTLFKLTRLDIIKLSLADLSKRKTLTNISVNAPDSGYNRENWTQIHQIFFTIFHNFVTQPSTKHKQLSS